MTKLKFSDGIEFDTSGPTYVLVNKSDGLYVVGLGLLCPVDTVEEGKQLIQELTNAIGKPDIPRV